MISPLPRSTPLLTLSLALAFAACGGSGDDSADNGSAGQISAGSGGATAGSAGKTGGAAGATGGTAGAAAGKAGAGAGGAGAAGSAGAATGGKSGSAGQPGGAAGFPGSSGNAGSSGSSAGGTGGAAAGSSGTAGTGGTAGAPTAGAGGTAGGNAGAAGGTTCTPPDVLLALDRTLTMHFTPEGINPTDAPNYASSKWAQAIAALKKVTASTDTTLRFGLELWPRNPGTGCVTLAERITDTKQATNPFCEEGEILVPPALGAGSAIASALDPLTTKICTSTPTGQALITASQYLTTHATPGRGQYVALVTDGADWDLSCPTPNPLTEVGKLAALGIKTFIVGFYAKSSAPGGVGIAFLNDMACAGQTATGFPAPCKQSGTSWVAADPNAAPIFLTAENSGQLEAVLTASLGEVGCKL